MPQYKASASLHKTAAAPGPCARATSSSKDPSIVATRSPRPPLRAKCSPTSPTGRRSSCWPTRPSPACTSRAWSTTRSSCRRPDVVIEVLVSVPRDVQLRRRRAAPETDPLRPGRLAGGPGRGVPRAGVRARPPPRQGARGAAARAEGGVSAAARPCGRRRRFLRRRGHCSPAVRALGVTP